MNFRADRLAVLFWMLIGGLLYTNPLQANHDHDDDEGCHGHEGNTPTIVRFVENKQQWEPHIRYAAEIPRGKVYFEDGKLTYLLANLSHLHDAWFHSDKPRNEIQIPIEGHAWYMHFEGANPSPELVSDQRYPDYNNYFIGDDPEKWASKVGIFGTVTYQNLYPGVNLKFYGKTNSLKYDVELAANADPNQVKFRYEGLDGMELVDGMLVMKTILGEVTEMAPYAYQSIDGRQVEVPCEFVLNGEVVSFGFPNGYDESLPLVIDPNLIFGSYTGSTADNFGYTATYDTSGNLYGGGIVFGMGYPVTPGAFQDTFQGGVNGLPFPTGFDISISKFNPTGTALVWSTYLGGTTSNEQPHSLITNDDAELVVYGRTWSTDYPVTAGAVQAANAGISDIVVTRLNAAGAGLIGSTYMGGTANDGLNIQTIFAQNGLYYNYGDDARGEVMLDDQDNIYIASCTQSNNFPVTAGVVQPAFGGGLQDGCVFKLNPNCTALLWSTYLGGAANDAAYSVKVSATNEPYVTGGTESADFPTTPGVVQTALAGGIDGFITRLNPTATGITASTFLGTSAYDQCYFLELDAAQNAYVIGQTRGNWPVTPGVYSNPNGNQFIARYDANLQNTGFSTVFGAGQNAVDISPTAFLVDRCGFIYVSGWGGSTNYEGDVGSLPVTSDAFQDSTANDSSDMYLLVLEPDAVGLEYASYYGGPTSAEHVDGGTSRFDKNLIVYQAVCAGCLFANNDFPTTPGVVSQTNNSNNCNLGVFKFAFEPQDVIAAYIATTFDSCAPFPVSFTNNSQGGVAYIWDYGDGSPLDTTFNAFHLYQVPGTYTVTLVAVDSNSCNFSDTSVQTVTVFANPIALAGGADTTCAGGAVQLTSGGGQFYDWSPGIWLSDSTIANPIANPQTDIVYEVIVRDTNGCTDTATVAIEVSEFEADAGPPTSFCEGTGGAQLMAGAINGGTSPYYYTWWCDSTNTFCGLDSMFDNDPIANPTQTTWYYLQVQDSRGCLSNIDSVLVEVLPVPIADAGADVGICQPPAPGVVLNGSFTNAPGPFTYYWIPGTGLNDSTLLNPYARPDTTTIYTLVGLSANGCSSNPTTTDTLSTVTVTVHPMPIAEAGPDLHVCATDSQIIQGFGSNAGPLYDFEWSPSTGLSDSTIANPIGSPPFTHEYILTVWSNGCPSIGDTMTLWVHTLPTPSAGNIQEICLGDSAYLDAFGAGDSSAFYTYEWMPGASMSDSTAENPAASPDTTTWYYLTVTSSWGCESPLDSVLVWLKPTPVAEAGPNLQMCAGDTVDLLGSYYYTTTDSANPSEIYYAWTPNQFISDSTAPQPQAWPDGSQWYYLDVRHNTCETRDSVFVTFNPELGGWVEADTTTICGGDSVQLYSGGGLGGMLYQWSPTDGLSDPNIANPIAAPSDSTTYQLVLLEGGCTDTLSIDMNVIPRPEMAYLSSATTGCAPFTVNFLDDSDTPIQYIWNFGDGSPVVNTQHPTHTYEAPGNYTVSLTGVNLGGCDATASDIVVNVTDPAAAAFITNPEFPATLPLPAGTVAFTDQSFNAMSWLWDFGDGTKSETQNPVHLYTSPGEYFATLTVLTAEGCRSMITHGPFTVYAPDLFIPNVFSPNDDDVNDGFLVGYSGSQPFFMEIFDRWGVRHFQTRNKLQPWRGQTEDGAELPEGVYYYHVTVGDQEYAGPVTLVR